MPRPVLGPVISGDIRILHDSLRFAYADVRLPLLICQSPTVSGMLSSHTKPGCHYFERYVKIPLGAVEHRASHPSSEVYRNEAERFVPLAQPYCR
jgi:hypothetical protein